MLPGQVTVLWLCSRTGIAAARIGIVCIIARIIAGIVIVRTVRSTSVVTVLIGSAGETLRQRLLWCRRSRIAYLRR